MTDQERAVRAFADRTAAHAATLADELDPHRTFDAGPLQQKLDTLARVARDIVGWIDVG